MSLKSAGAKPARNGAPDLPTTLDAAAVTAVDEALRRQEAESLSWAERLTLDDIRRQASARTSEAQGKAAAAAPANRAQKVFGVAGTAVTLAGQPYHLAELSAAGTMAVRAFLEANGLPGFPRQEDGTSIGQLTVRFATLVGVMDGLSWLLPRIIAEEVPEGIEYEASERELIAVVDAFWEASGIDWYERLAKNSAAGASPAMTTN